MNFAENTDLRAIGTAVRELRGQFDDDYWIRRELEHEFPWDFYAAMAKGGWIGIAVPEAYGGGGQGITEASIVLEEVAPSGTCMNGAGAIHLSVFGMHPVVLHGSEELKQRHLTEVAVGDNHIAFGVTEPVNDHKVCTSKALGSDRVLLLTRTTPKAQCAKPIDGMTLFVASLRDPAVHITAIPRLGRNAVASEALGSARGAQRRAVDYAQERVVFGRRIGAAATPSAGSAGDGAELLGEHVLGLPRSY